VLGPLVYVQFLLGKRSEAEENIAKFRSTLDSEAVGDLLQSVRENSIPQDNDFIELLQCGRGFANISRLIGASCTPKHNRKKSVPGSPASSNQCSAPGTLYERHGLRAAHALCHNVILWTGETC
jgi:hypothetical protein